MKFRGTTRVIIRQWFFPNISLLFVCAALIQLMAAARARRGLAFFTFGDEELRRGLQQIYGLLVTEETTVGETLKCFSSFSCFTFPDT